MIAMMLQLQKLSTVKDMNVQVYNEIGLSKEQFHATYPYFYDYGANQTPADLGTCEETTDAETQSYSRNQMDYL